MSFRTVKTSEVPEIHDIFAQADVGPEFKLGTFTHVEPCRWKFARDSSREMIYSDGGPIPLFPGETIEDAMKGLTPRIKLSAVKLPANRLDDEFMTEIAFRQMRVLQELANKSDCGAAFVLALSRALASTVVDDMEADAEELILTNFMETTRKGITELRKVDSHRGQLMKALKRFLDAHKP